MARIIWRQRAIEDLNAIWEYTLIAWSENQADTYYNAIKFASNEIAANPLLGKTYSGISNDLLGLKSGKHIIFYHVVSENEIEIIRILHERMDLKNRIS
ncbi:type II toxin-antitoxin system RelE/ParE family toxin [Flagellimonas flava]|uniref:type II toxin-antitoxin system RelE/ParE family toxin n=1 Tax=Flagellimonas flava TaxID=570519 RepID=UPI003D647D73